MTITVGIAQTSNSVDVERNFQSIKSLLLHFENIGADLVLFPECSLSGFSSKMKESTLDHLKPYLEDIQRWVQRTGIEVVLPTAVVENGSIYNSGWWLKRNEVIQFYKIGLTDSEKGFFSLPSDPGLKVFQTKGFRFAVLVCFEIEHEPWTYFQPGDVDAILWPGYWGWDLESKWEQQKAPDEKNLIFSNVNAWKCPVLQSNFAFNDLEGHKGAGPEGLSFVIDSNNNHVGCGAHQKIDGLLVTLKKKEDKTVIQKMVSLLG